MWSFRPLPGRDCPLRDATCGGLFLESVDSRSNHHLGLSFFGFFLAGGATITMAIYSYGCFYKSGGLKGPTVLGSILVPLIFGNYKIVATTLIPLY